MTASNKRKYSGSIETLQSTIARCGVVGVWASRAEPQLHTFRSTTGEIINWWPRTRTVQFQGKMSPDFVQNVIDNLGSSVCLTKRKSEQPAMFL